MTVVRIRATGQVIDMVPNAAGALLASGMAERVMESKVIQTAEAQAAPRVEQAVKPAAASSRRKAKR